MIGRGFRAATAQRQPLPPAQPGGYIPHIMSLLIARGVVIRLGGRTLLDNADLTIDPGRHVGPVSYTHLRAHET